MRSPPDRHSRLPRDGRRVPNWIIVRALTRRAGVRQPPDSLFDDYRQPTSIREPRKSSWLTPWPNAWTKSPGADAPRLAWVLLASFNAGTMIQFLTHRATRINRLCRLASSRSKIFHSHCHSYQPTGFPRPNQQRVTLLTYIIDRRFNGVFIGQLSI